MSAKTLTAFVLTSGMNHLSDIINYSPQNETLNPNLATGIQGQESKRAKLRDGVTFSPVNHSDIGQSKVSVGLFM